MTGVFAQLKRDLIRQRTNEGLETARAHGRTGGRKPKLTEAKAKALVEMYSSKTKTVAEIAEVFGITSESCYRYIRAANAA
jgi:DNA invertase Pin-like site-specific DNA recombinase